MKPFVADPDFTLFVGDVREALLELPDESVHCVVTSPPYWGLRDYGTGSWEGGDPDCDHRVGGQVEDKKAKGAITAGVRPGVDASACLDCGATRLDRQIGLELTPDAYVEEMVAVFREVRRVLRKDGTVWLNLGDSYAGKSSGGWGDSHSTLRAGRLYDGDRARQEVRVAGSRHKVVDGLKGKDLVGIPWRVAFALQADGWWLRSDIIWSKPNPMPASVTDRPTVAHEYVFLLAKNGRYFYDVDAIREPHQYDGRTKTVHDHRTDDSHPNYDHIGTGNERWPNGGRNKRTVWTIPTESYPEAHFATFPQALVEPCISAGTSEHGVCPECGAPWKRIVEVEYDAVGRTTNGPRSMERRHLEHGSAGYGQRLEKRVETVGWKPGCDHGKSPIPATVLDPFMGSGTTALVARRLGRRSVGIELNPEYATLAARRLSQLSLFAEEPAA